MALAERFFSAMRQPWCGRCVMRQRHHPISEHSVLTAVIMRCILPDRRWVVKLMPCSMADDTKCDSG